MNYVDQVLQPGETLAYRTTLHWFVYLRAIVVFIIALGLAISAFFLPGPDGRFGFLAAAAVATALAVLFWLSAFISRCTTELAITNRRVIYKSGLLQRKTFEMNLTKVESVGVTQSIAGRIMGFGEVEVKGTGASLAPVTRISNPLRFRSYITAHE